MIDPFSCLSIATAIAQFIDVGLGVLKKAREIQKTAVNSEVSDFEEDLNRFKRLCAAVKDAHGRNVATTVADGHEITDVAKRCEMLSDEILALLEKLKVSDNTSTMRNLKVAFKLQAKGSELEKYEGRLMATKVDLCNHMLLAFGMIFTQKSYSTQRSNQLISCNR